MWLVDRQHRAVYKILHARNGRPHSTVDGFCAEITTVFEFLGCYWHGYTSQTFRDVSTKDEDTLAEKYERTMARF